MEANEKIFQLELLLKDSHIVQWLAVKKSKSSDVLAYTRGIITVVKIKVVLPLRGCLKATITGEVAYLISISGDN